MTSEISNKIANMGVVCAMMVTLIHLPCPEQGASLAFIRRLLPYGVCRIAVPFFFVAAGYLLAGHIEEKSWWSKAVRKRVWTLLVPMVIWDVLWLAFLSMLPMMANLVHGRELSKNVPILTWVEFSRLLGLHPFAEPYLGVLWFVRMLFVLVVFSPLLKFLATPFGVSVLYVLQLLLGPSLAGTPPPIRFTLLKGFFPVCGAAAFTFGMMLRIRAYSVDFRNRRGAHWLACGFLVMVVSYLSRSETILAFADWLYVPFLLVGVWSICPAKRFPRIFICAAFPMYVMHSFVNTLISLMLFSGTMTACRYVFGWLLSVGVCLLLAWVSGKILPRLSAFAYGNRAR